MVAEDTIAYPVGKHIGLKNLKTGKMNFIEMREDVREISGLYMSSGRRYLAVALRLVHDTSPYVVIYELRNLNSLKTPKSDYINVLDIAFGTGGRNAASRNAERLTYNNVPVSLISDEVWNPTLKDIKSLEFSEDDRLLGILLSDRFYDKDGNLVPNQEKLESRALVYEWARGKDQTHVNHAFSGTIVNKFTFNPRGPRDGQQFCTTGPGHWKIWRIQEQGLKPLPASQKLIQEGKNYTDHSWLDDDRLVASTSTGELFILQHLEMKQKVADAFAANTYQNQQAQASDKKPESQGIMLIRPYSKGFFLAGEKGTMVLWVRSEENNATSEK